MHRSSRLFAFAVLACSAAAGAFLSAAVASRDFVVSVSRGVWDFALSVFRTDAKVQAKQPSREKSRVALVAAQAFVLRVFKRRPTVHPTWRLCPSI